MKSHFKTAALIFFAASISAFAQTNKSQLTKQSLSSAEVNIESDTLTKDFLNGKHLNNIVKVLLPLTKLYKDKYETGLEYDARIADAFRKISPNESSLYAFIFDNKVEYTPEIEQFNIPYHSPLCKEGAHIQEATCFLTTINKKEARYTGTNAFGVSAGITKTTGADINIEMSDMYKTWRIFEKSNRNYTPPFFEFPLSEARKLRNETIYPVLIGSIVSPGMTQTSGRYNKPTISSPYELSTEGLNIHIRPEALWFVASPSGVVIHKINVNQ